MSRNRLDSKEDKIDRVSFSLSNSKGSILFAFAVILFCIFIEYPLSTRLPSTKLKGKADLSPENFIYSNARKHLKDISSLGPRLAGTRVNEVVTPKMIISKLNHIIKSCHENVIIEVQEQHPSSSFFIDFLGGMENV